MGRAGRIEKNRLFFQITESETTDFAYICFLNNHLPLHKSGSAYQSIQAMNQIKEKPQLTYIEALKNALDKIIQIQGRSRRSEYWWTRGTVFLVSIVLARLFSPFGLLVLNLLTIPLTFRRLHDTGRSGWWLGVSILLRCSLTVIFIADICTHELHLVFPSPLALERSYPDIKRN